MAGQIARLHRGLTHRMARAQPAVPRARAGLREAPVHVGERSGTPGAKVLNYAVRTAG